MTTRPKRTKKIMSEKTAWDDLQKKARECQRTWGMGFPVISIALLEKYWNRAIAEAVQAERERCAGIAEKAIREEPTR